MLGFLLKRNCNSIPYPLRLITMKNTSRIILDGVDYASIEKYCGISCEALIRQMKRQSSRLIDSDQRIRGHRITEDEIKIAQDGMKKYYIKLGIYNPEHVFDDDITPDMIMNSVRKKA